MTIERPRKYYKKNHRNTKKDPISSIKVPGKDQEKEYQRIRKGKLKERATRVLEKDH